MDTVKVSRALLVGNDRGLTIKYYTIQHVHINIFNGKNINRYQRYELLQIFIRRVKIDTCKERELLDVYGS